MPAAQRFDNTIPKENMSDRATAFYFLGQHGTADGGGCDMEPVPTPSPTRSPAIDNLHISERRVGRCMCSREGVVRKTSKKRPNPSVGSGTVETIGTATAEHIVPNVQVFTPTCNSTGPAALILTAAAGTQTIETDGRCGQLDQENFAPTSSTNNSVPPAAVPPVKKVNRATNTNCNHSSDETANVTCPPCKSILTKTNRNHWNCPNAVTTTTTTSADAVAIDHDAHQMRQHESQPPCLRRYGSSQSCKSAATLRSVTSTSRGMMKNRYVGPTSGDSYSEELDRDDAEDEKIPGGPGLNERELWSLHRAVPGLRRHDPRTSTIRQHYYPEGGWGWLVVGAAFLVQVLTTGLQFAFGVLATQVVKHFQRENSTVEIVWIGVLQLTGSWLWAPFVVALCRRKSTRLAAVLGGLALALVTLFTSFAQQLHQVFLSYGALMSIAIALVRETSALMVGQYFKRRRDFVEIVVQIGSGIGVILFSVFFKEALGNLGWRLGLQAATGLLLSAFFLGTFYRSASLYHPQRRAILHLKTQRKKVKVKGKPSNDRPPYFDFSVLRLKSLRMILLSSGIGSVGAYTPLFYLALQGEADGLEPSDLLLIHTFLGLAMATGTVVVGLIVLRPSTQCLISLQYLCQANLFGIAVSLLALATVNGYHGYILFAWIYGFCLGGYQYALHQYTLDRVRARQFARGWALVLAARALPALFGIPIAGYINQSTPRAGYYFSFTFTVIGAVLLFLSKMYRHSTPPALFLGGGRRTPSFHRRTSESTSQRSDTRDSGRNRDSRGKLSSQEPLFQRDEPSTGSADCPPRIETLPSVRTIHQDVCTCHHQPRPVPTRERPRNLRDKFKALKRGLHSHRWWNAREWKNPFAGTLGLFSLDSGASSSGPNRTCLADDNGFKPESQQQQYPYEIPWEPSWNGCIGSCHDLVDAEDVDCRVCHSCVDCGYPLDDEDDEEGDIRPADGHGPTCQMHPMIVIPDAVDIPELPPQVQRSRFAQGRRTLGEMSFSDPEHLPTIGLRGHSVYMQRDGHHEHHQHVGHFDEIPRLPNRILRRQNTWHDVSALTRDVDVIEQITTSV